MAHPHDCFAEAERHFNLRIPVSLKNILVINGYEEENIIARITDTSLNNIENFCRNDLPKIVHETDLNQYLGVYSKQPQLFKIVEGHRELIFMLVDYFKQNTTKKIDKSTGMEDFGKQLAPPRARIIPKTNLKSVNRPTISDGESNDNSQDNNSCSKLSNTLGNEKIPQENQSEKNHILDTLRSWFKSHVTTEDWNNDFSKQFEKITVNFDTDDNGNMHCLLKCYCEARPYTIPKLSKKLNGAKRWIYSNFESHLKKHFPGKHCAKNRKSSTVIVPQKVVLKQGSLNSFFNNPPHSSKAIISKTCDFDSTNETVKWFERKKDLEINSEEATDIRNDFGSLTTVDSEVKYRVKSSKMSLNNLVDFEVDLEAPSKGCGTNSTLNVEPSAEQVAGNSTLQTDFSCNLNFSQCSQDDVFNDCRDYCASIDSAKIGAKINLIQNIKIDPPLKFAARVVDNNQNSSLYEVETIENEAYVVNEASQNVDTLNNFCQKQKSDEKSDESSSVKTSISSSISSNKSKWTDQKYQRRERQKRLREKIDEKQTFITDYYALADRISIIMEQNPQEADIILSKITDGPGSDQTSSTRNKISSFLQHLLDISIKNSEGSKFHNSYDEATKKFAVYLYYIGGKLLYETLYANLKNALPSISTLNRYLENNRPDLEEGAIDFSSLSSFLEERNSPKVVWISEDATRITGKIEYDNKSNKVVGFVLPLKDGMPQTETYVATSAETIAGYFKIGVKANYGYTIMAQGLAKNTPAFCIALFGTDNKFSYQDVLKRWKNMELSAEKFGIRIAGFSSDGDTRLLKAMKISTGLQQPTEETAEWFWFQMALKLDRECCIQDTVHILTKLRTRILKPGIVLPIGDHTVSVNHLQELISKVSKDKHLLTQCDLKPEDKMNYLSAEKMCSFSVIMHLEESIPGSAGTCLYLKLVRYILSSFLDKSMNLKNRIFYIWYVVFVLRLWRAWIKESKSYTIKDNFLTNNSYLCVEINAHSLIKLIMQLKSEKLDPSMFRIWTFSSQACEQLFRSARSMSSTYSTIINFSLKEFRHRINRIKFSNHVVNDLASAFVFPREEKKSFSNMHGVHQITQEEIKSLNIQIVVEEALQKALTDIEKLGLVIKNQDAWKLIDIPLNTTSLLPTESHSELNNDSDDDVLDDEPILPVIEPHLRELSEPNNADNKQKIQQESMFCNINDDIFGENFDENIQALANYESLDFKDYSESVLDVDPNSQFVKVQLSNNKTITIKKSSYCWLLEESSGKVSTDRLRRFFTKKGTQATTSTIDQNRNMPATPSKRKARNSDKTTKCKKARPARQRCKFSDEETSTEEEISYDDSTVTESFNSETEIEEKIFQVDDFVVVELVSEKGFKDRFVAKIASINPGRVPYSCLFLRKQGTAYVYPVVPDEGNVEEKEIIGKLSNPTILKRGRFLFEEHELNVYLQK